MGVHQSDRPTVAADFTLGDWLVQPSVGRISRGDTFVKPRGAALPPRDTQRLVEHTFAGLVLEHQDEHLALDRRRPPPGRPGGTGRLHQARQDEEADRPMACDAFASAWKGADPELPVLAEARRVCGSPARPAGQ